jgi:hypothetical protein
MGGALLCMLEARVTVAHALVGGIDGDLFQAVRARPLAPAPDGGGGGGGGDGDGDGAAQPF